MRHMSMKLNLEAGKTYAASLAPSFPAYFDCHPLQLVKALKLCGFQYVEETAVVLPAILALRKKAVEERAEPVIGESCPRTLALIQSDFPHLAKYLASIPSPMELHGQVLKQKYGSDCMTVFFSPCIYKKLENAGKRAMDAVHTFSELETFMNERLTTPLNQLEQAAFDSRLASKTARLGVLSMTVHGEKAACNYFRQFPVSDSPLFSEVLYCDGGCAQTACLAALGHICAAERILSCWEGYD